MLMHRCVHDLWVVHPGSTILHRLVINGRILQDGRTRSDTFHAIFNDLGYHLAIHPDVMFSTMAYILRHFCATVRFPDHHVSAGGGAPEPERILLYLETRS